MQHVVHIASGETALCKTAEAGNVLLQFDRFDHPHSHGWHLYRVEAVRFLPEAQPLYPGPEVGGPMHNVLRRG